MYLHKDDRELLRDIIVTVKLEKASVIYHVILQMEYIIRLGNL